jgi:hypothetical protein
MARHAGTLGAQAQTLLKAHPESALVAAGIPACAGMSDCVGRAERKTKNPGLIARG